MSVRVNQEKCSGCQACVDACPESAISMENGLAAINQALCTQCEACISLCPPGALYTEVNEAQIVPAARPPAPAKAIASALPERRALAPWLGTTLAFLGQEILPRLANVAMTALERRPEKPASASVNADWRIVSGDENHPNHLRRRKRGNFS